MALALVDPAVEPGTGVGDRGRTVGPLETGRAQAPGDFALSPAYLRWLGRVEGLRDLLRVSNPAFARDVLGCTPQEWHRFRVLEREMPQRVVDQLCLNRPDFLHYWRECLTDRVEEALSRMPRPRRRKPPA